MWIYSIQYSRFTTSKELRAGEKNTKRRIILLILQYIVMNICYRRFCSGQFQLLSRKFTTKNCVLKFRLIKYLRLVVTRKNKNCTINVCLCKQYRKCFTFFFNFKFHKKKPTECPWPAMTIYSTVYGVAPYISV
jgi:hypothetical protein